MKTQLMIVAAFALLAGCTSAPPTDTPQISPPVAEAPASPDTCGMARFQSLIGTPASAIDQSTLPPGTRILSPDSIVTQDFRQDRLNIFTGTDGRVSSMRCF